MKKMVSLLMTLMLGLSIVACDNKNITSTDTNDISSDTTVSDVPETSIETISESDNISVENSTSDELTEDAYIGTWEWKDFSEKGPINGVTHMELYVGGTGKGTNSTHKGTNSYYPITWEIKDHIINIKASNAPTVGMKLEDGKLVAVDGTWSYTKIE